MGTEERGRGDGLYRREPFDGAPFDRVHAEPVEALRASRAGPSTSSLREAQGKQDKQGKQSRDVTAGQGCPAYDCR